MQLSETLETYLQRASRGLQIKIRNSIELIRKAEKLALLYDSENGFWLGFSGGKDSQTLMHLTQLAGVCFKAYFSPTSVDPPQVIRFIRENYPEVTFTKLKTSIYKMMQKKKCLPSRRIRWCCAEFKEKGGEGKVTLVGVRKAESVKRSKRKDIEVSGHKFSGNLEQFEQWSAEKRARKAKRMQFDQFSEHKEQMVTCVGGKDKIVVSPILEWSDADVWEFLNKVVQVPHCSLYDEGRTRIGCIMCPMSTTKNIRADAKRFPHVYEKWVQAIMQLRKDTAIEGGEQPIIPERTHQILPSTMENSHNFAQLAYIPGNGVELHSEEEERLIAENILDWWMSKKSYKQWYREKYEYRDLFENININK